MSGGSLCRYVICYILNVYFLILYTSCYVICNVIFYFKKIIISSADFNCYNSFWIFI